MPDFKLDDYGDITGEIISEENAMALQRVFHIIRSYENDHPLTAAYGNPSDLSDKFNPQNYINLFTSETNDLLAYDSLVQGIFSISLNIEPETNKINLSILNTRTKAPIETIKIDYSGKLNLPNLTETTTIHNYINTKQMVNDELCVLLKHVSFINSKLVYVSQDKPILQKIEVPFRISEKTSMTDFLNGYISSNSFYIDSIIFDIPHTISIYPNDIILTKNTIDTNDEAIITVNYLERNITSEPSLSNILIDTTTPIIKNLNKYSCKIRTPEMKIGEEFYIMSGLSNV